MTWIASNATNAGDTNWAYSLKVNGVNVLESVPVNMFPISWQDTADNGVGTMNFTVHDPAPAWAASWKSQKFS